MTRVPIWFLFQDQTVFWQERAKIKPWKKLPPPSVSFFVPNEHWIQWGTFWLILFQILTSLGKQMWKDNLERHYLNRWLIFGVFATTTIAGFHSISPVSIYFPLCVSAITPLQYQGKAAIGENSIIFHLHYHSFQVCVCVIIFINFLLCHEHPFLPFFLKEEKVVNKQVKH